jgi:hypothetical protein
MKQQLFPEKSHAERLEIMRETCRSAEYMQVKIQFTQEDLDEMKSRLSEICIEKDAIEDALREQSKEYRLKIKELVKIVKVLLENLKNKYEYQNQQVFLYDDQEEGLMHTYNVNGELIATRNLTPSEKQTRIK